MMTVQDHIREAENCLEVSDYLYGRGMRLLGSEMIWLAAKYAVNAVALRNGINHGTYRQKEAALTIIAAGHPREGALLAAFDKARHRIHPNSDKDHISEAELNAHCDEVKDFVSEMLAIARAALP